MPTPYVRGTSARSILKIEWDYPVYTQPVQEDTERSFAKRKRQALSRADAVKAIAGDDPRPLLVLRECKVCNGTDDALLKGGADNEKTFILSSWFHCVKLPVDVMEEDHPFHAMFTEEKPEHLFVCSVDGSNHDPLESQTSRTELWKSMRKLLAQEYKSKPDSSVKKIAKLLDKMDVVDRRLGELTARRDDILEEDGPGSRKLKKLAKSIVESERDRDSLIEDVAEASKLELKRNTKKDASSRETAKAGG